MEKRMNFIMIPRKMFDSGFFGGEAYSRREAFFDLVQMAELEILHLEQEKLDLMLQ